MRALLRLTNSRHLARIERRVPGGARGGSGQYVYQLGSKGFYEHFDGRYIPARAVSFHTLGIADAYVALHRLEREGAITLVALSTEPDCWATIGSVTLKPDMFVELALKSGEHLKLWLEVDMGTEAQRQLRSKLEMYWRAYNEADVSVWPVFPRVLWVAVDDERARELSWLMKEGSADAQAIFQVTTMEKLPELFR